MMGNAQICATPNLIGDSIVQFCGHEVSFLTLGGVLLQEVGEEEHLEDGKDDEQLHGNNEPERAPSVIWRKPS